MLNHFITTLVTLVIGFHLSVSQASDFHSPRTDALGGAGHASPLLTDAIYLNPSFTSFMQSHALSLNYLSFCCGTIARPEGMIDFYGHNLNVSVLDGTTESLFQAGVGYTRREDASFLHIGASKAVIERMGIGVGAKFIFPNDNSGNRLTDGTYSMTGLFADWFQSSLIVDNMFEAARPQGLFREFTLGTKFNVSKIILLYLDPNWTPSLPNDASKWGYQAGVEFPFFSEVFFRLGMFKNSNVPYQSQKGDGYGIGLGWMAPKLSLDYAFSKVNAPLSSMSHNFGFTIYF